MYIIFKYPHEHVYSTCCTHSVLSLQGLLHLSQVYTVCTITTLQTILLPLSYPYIRMCSEHTLAIPCQCMCLLYTIVLPTVCSDTLTTQPQWPIVHYTTVHVIMGCQKSRDSTPVIKTLPTEHKLICTLIYSITVHNNNITLTLYCYIHYACILYVNVCCGGVEE